MGEIKKCRKCREEKTLECFPKMNIGKFGRGSTCFPCIKLSQKPQKELSRTPINKIGTKRKERIKKHGSEVEMFKKIWKERKHNCCECGRYIREPKVHNFDHIKTKGSRVDLRLDEDNIQIICFKCHFEKTNGMVYKGIDLDF